MKNCLTLLFLLLAFVTKASPKDSTLQLMIPDSLKAISIIADVELRSPFNKRSRVGLKTNGISLLIENEKGKQHVAFEFPKTAEILVTGLHCDKEKDEISWELDSKPGAGYKLLMASAADRAENFVLYSGYIFLTDIQKWKLIGTCKINGFKNFMSAAQVVYSFDKKKNATAAVNNIWVQASKGGWKTLGNNSEATKAPLISWMSSVDSVEQAEIDKKIIDQSIASGVTTPHRAVQGVYYNIENPGDGKSFTVNDSITARYQLRIFGSSSVISGSATESYTFLLKSLIKGWQLTVPFVKTGGKIHLLIPSGLGYSIRTRSPKIPPNSILSFKIDVLDAKVDPGK